MSFEKPIFGTAKIAKAEKQEVSERDLESDLGGLESGLQRILDGKDVDYAGEMKKIEGHLAVMKKKYEGKEKIINFLDRWSDAFSTIGLGFALLSIPIGLARGFEPASNLGTAGMVGMSIKALSEFVNGPNRKKAQEIRNNIEELINKSREFTSVYLHKGGAEYDGRGRLEVTGDQVENAREEMNKDLEKRGKV